MPKNRAYRIEKNIPREKGVPAYLRLYESIRSEILGGSLPYGSKLPSKRQLCADHGVSVITAQHALEILADEGYIDPRERSGCYVVYREQDLFPAVSPHGDHDAGTVESTGISAEAAGTLSAELEGFSFSVFARTMRRVLSEYGEGILIKSPNNGFMKLRAAISDYLARSRGMKVSPEQIIIGSGAEYLYGLVVQILGRGKVYAAEKPSYEKIEQVYGANDVAFRLLPLGSDGIVSDALRKTDADVLHITPYRSYPSGVTASAAKRREYIRWADAKEGRFIVEDDFESEFTPSTKPEETVFSLSEKGNVIYLNTFSRTIAPAIRTGYMVLPEKLMGRYEEKAGFYSCAVPTFEQYVLAEFIGSGDFERHINRVRRRNRKRE